MRETPPDQDYASGHSIEGGAAAQVLKRFFGTDHVIFQDCSTTLPAGSTCNDPSAVTRSYTSFSEAAARTRIRASSSGFTSAKSVEEGTEYGRKIGKRAANLYLGLCTELCARSSHSSVRVRTGRQVERLEANE